jgi:secretory phospholipase A2
MTNSAASNMVGKIFFNIIQTKCFVLKPEKTCLKRSWWGKCLKEGLEKKAHIRDALKY